MKIQGGNAGRNAATAKGSRITGIHPGQTLPGGFRILAMAECDDSTCALAPITKPPLQRG